MASDRVVGWQNVSLCRAAAETVKALAELTVLDTVLQGSSPPADGILESLLLPQLLPGTQEHLELE